MNDKKVPVRSEEEIDEILKGLYLSDKYIINNPSIHEEDSPWKVDKIRPLVDRFIEYINKDEINLLDVGGGAGLILNAVSSYIYKNYGTKVNKFSLDLSPGMLEIQKKANRDLKRTLNEDIRKTSLGNKEIDLTLMIDVLEHVPNPIEALTEVKRTSNFVILKVPLEDNLQNRVWNFIKRGKPRKDSIKISGHINIYNYNKLKCQIEEHMGQVLDIYFTNVFYYYINSEYYTKKIYTKKMSILRKLINFSGLYLFKLSPKLCSLIFSDFVVILVKNY